MKYPPQDSQLIGSRFGSRSIDRRSVAETRLETLSETLGQGGLRPGLARPAGRPRRGRRLAGALAMLTGLGTLGFVFWRPASEPRAAAGEPVAVLEIAHGRARLLTGDPGAARQLLMLAGGEPIHAGAVIETGGAASGLAAVRLAGGQSLRLDSGSRVRFATSSAVALERGALYVDSAGGDHVEVRTALGVVRDIGTRFEVRLLPGTDAGRSVRIRVREGSVELEGSDQPHLVVAGEELRMRADGGVERGASPIYGPQWDWVLATAQAPAIAGRPLESFLDWVEREGGWTVRFADPATAVLAADTILHGDVSDLSLTEAASVVLQGSGLDYRLEGGTFVVVADGSAAGSRSGSPGAARP